MSPHGIGPNPAESTSIRRGSQRHRLVDAAQPRPALPRALLPVRGFVVPFFASGGMCTGRTKGRRRPGCRQGLHRPNAEESFRASGGFPVLPSSVSLTAGGWFASSGFAKPSSTPTRPSSLRGTYYCNDAAMRPAMTGNDEVLLQWRITAGRQSSRNDVIAGCHCSRNAASLQLQRRLA